MNSIFFGLKRAYYGTLRGTWMPLREIGLTAARCDVLAALNRHAQTLLQGELRRILGVSGATLSRMLKSMEERGLITREPANDKRRLVVKMAETAQKLLYAAYELDADIRYPSDPRVHIDGPDGDWYELWVWRADRDTYHETVREMVKRLRALFGPYAAWIWETPTGPM